MEKNISNWGNYPVIKSDEFLFTTVDEAKQKIDHHEHIFIRGNGRCYGDASLAEVTLKTTKFNKIIDFDIENGILDMQSGITLDRIINVIVPKGWFLPVTPGTKFITIGGALASDVHGKNHHLEGAISKHVIDFDLVTAKETLLVDRESNPQLFDATSGGMGLTGFISRIKLQLKKIETAYIKQKQIKAENLDEILELFEKYNHYTYSVAWIDCLKKGKNFGRSILMLGEHALINELDANKLKEPLKVGPKPKLNFPFYLPNFALNNFSIKVFNWLYYNKNLKKEQDSVTHYEPFFYPLDIIDNWNRMYGKRGFIQYQFVIPFANGVQGLKEILIRINNKGLGSFLAVLKTFGEQESIIGFPVAGYTLALDFPVTKDLMPFLDELDHIVAAYGGRIYLSKDARMKAHFFQKTYERFPEFKEIVKQYNPGFKYSSLQAKRLNII